MYGQLILTAQSNLSQVAAPPNVQAILHHPQTQAILQRVGSLQICWGGHNQLSHVIPEGLKSTLTSWVIHLCEGDLQICCIATFGTPVKKVEACGALQQLPHSTTASLWLPGRYDHYSTPHGH